MQIPQVPLTTKQRRALVHELASRLTSSDFKKLGPRIPSQIPDDVLIFDGQFHRLWFKPRVLKPWNIDAVPKNREQRGDVAADDRNGWRPVVLSKPPHEMIARNRLSTEHMPFR